MVITLSSIIYFTHIKEFVTFSLAIFIEKIGMIGYAVMTNNIDLFPRQSRHTAIRFIKFTLKWTSLIRIVWLITTISLHKNEGDYFRNDIL